VVNMPTKYVKLFFQSADEGGHYEILSYPVSEMEGNTPEAIADELVGISNSVSWKRSCRRRISAGDYMLIGNDRYYFTDSASGSSLDIWSYLSIAKE